MQYKRRDRFNVQPTNRMQERVKGQETHLSIQMTTNSYYNRLYALQGTIDEKPGGFTNF